MITNTGFTGTKEVAKALDHVSHKLGSAMLRSFNRKASKKVVIPILSNAIHSKRAQNNLKVQAVRGEKRAIVTGVGRSTYWERFLQKGTERRETKKGYNRGAMHANFKLSKAADKTVRPILDYTSKNLGKEVKRMMLSKTRSTQRRTARL